MFTCGHCGRAHHYATTARLCATGVEVYPCTWLVEVPGDESTEWRPRIVECGSSSWSDERATQCEAGHEHVELQHRLAEGWDYASDEDEARLRASYGYESRLPDGHLFLG